MAREVPDLGGKAMHQRVYQWVPDTDFKYLRQGVQSEVRVPGHPAKLRTPRPLIVWTRRGLQTPHVLMVLQDMWREPLGAITKDSLTAYGCEHMDEFRQEWCYRNHRRGFPPEEIVCCFRLRPWRPADDREYADSIFRYLYGDFLP